MSPARHSPDPADDPARQLAREIARRHAARRRAPMALAVAAVALGVAIAAATDADAATLGYAPTAGSGHGHALAAEPDDGSSTDPAVPNPLNALKVAGRTGTRAQGGNEQGGNGDGAGGQGRGGRANNDQGGNDQGGNDQGRDGQGRNGQADGQGRDGRVNNGQGQNGQNNQGQNDQNDDQNGNDQNQNTNGLDVLARDCGGSRLTPHTGFQIAPACVSTAFGEVAAAEDGPSLLITDAPDETRVGQSFTLKVSTRNLVRDRFLGAAAGGYYLESSVLTSGGLQRGHFHTACRMLSSTREAPESGPSPAFFVATQDNGGGARPDTVSITVNGMPDRGTAQCTSWAGDGSHRIPMMQRADQTPAIDSVRITVR